MPHPSPYFWGGREGAAALHKPTTSTPMFTCIIPVTTYDVLVQVLNRTISCKAKANWPIGRVQRESDNEKRHRTETALDPGTQTGILDNVACCLLPPGWVSRRRRPRTTPHPLGRIDLQGAVSFLFDPHFFLGSSMTGVCCKKTCLVPKQPLLVVLYTMYEAQS